MVGDGWQRWWSTLLTAWRKARVRLGLEIGFSKNVAAFLRREQQHCGRLYSRAGRQPCLLTESA